MEAELRKGNVNLHDRSGMYHMADFRHQKVFTNKNHKPKTGEDFRWNLVRAPFF